MSNGTDRSMLMVIANLDRDERKAANPRSAQSPSYQAREYGRREILQILRHEANLVK